MTALYKPRPEHWPQLSLRGLFVLVTLLGVVLGWIAVQLKWVKDRREAIEWIKLQDEYELIGDSGGEFRSHLDGSLSISATPVDFEAPVPGSLQLFGDRAIHLIHLPASQDKVGARSLHSKLGGLFPEATVIVDGVDSD
jgi:hypothetical protein